MKFAFLPHYFKKISLACFFGSIAIIIVAGVIATMHAALAVPEEGIAHSYKLGFEVGRSFATSNYWVIQVCGILILLSMAFYMLAKEKVDDEYMDAMRWESLRLALIVSIGVTMLSIILHVSLSAKSILFILFIVYLIAFKLKKSNN